MILKDLDTYSQVGFSVKSNINFLRSPSPHSPLPLQTLQWNTNSLPNFKSSYDVCHQLHIKAHVNRSDVIWLILSWGLLYHVVTQPEKDSSSRPNVLGIRTGGKILHITSLFNVLVTYSTISFSLGPLFFPKFYSDRTYYTSLECVTNKLFPLYASISSQLSTSEIFNR